VDFTIEVERSLRVLDGAVTVLDAQAGVEPQTENVWRQAETYGVPRIVFVNKMYKIGADFDKSVKSLHERLNANAHAVQMPIGSAASFERVTELCMMVANITDEEKMNIKWETVPVLDKYREEGEERRNDLIVAVADVNDGIMEKFLGGEEIS